MGQGSVFVFCTVFCNIISCLVSNFLKVLMLGVSRILNGSVFHVWARWVVEVGRLLGLLGM